MLNILIADDHELIRKGLRQVLEIRTDWRVCAEADNGRTALELATRVKPHIAILDVAMPELNGLDATRALLKASPESQVLILTMHESEELIREVLDAGARGYLLKADAASLLISAVEALARRKPFFTGKVSELVLHRTENGRATHSGRPPTQRLSLREREILQLLTEGKTSKEIANRLSISAKTVEVHRTNLMRKLDLHSVAELVRYAIRNQIIQA